MLLFELLILGFLPGAVIFRLPVLDRDKRAALAAEERLFWAVIISVSLSTAIVLALAAAHRYSFERLLIGDLAVAGLAAAAARFKLRFGAGAPRIGLTALLPLTLVVLGLWRFFPSSEYVMGGKDPGTYMNEGVQIAQRGRLVVADPVVASLPAFARPLFFPISSQTGVYSVRFMGFFVRNPDSGEVVGQFPHFFPASIAIGYGLDGLSGARRTVGVWAILGLLAVYFAGARLLGRPAAWAAAVLLGVHVIEVWFARYPNAEVVMQALLFAAVLASARANVDDDAFFAPVAGVLLGLLLFVRFDAVLGIGAVGSAVALSSVITRRVPWTFAVTLTAVVALGAVYLCGMMRHYVDLPVVFVTNLRWWQVVALALGGALLIAAVAAAARFDSVRTAIARITPMLITGTVVVGALYALYFRQPAEFVLAARDAYALRTFTSFYLTLPALIAALVGFVLVARQAFWRAPELLTTITVFSCFFFYKIRIVSDHFWMTRRFLPVILPGALLLVAAAAWSGIGRRLTVRQMARALIGTVFLALLGAQYARASRPILNHVEYAGLIPKLEALASSIGDRDLLVMETRATGTDTHVLGLPLAYIYDRSVIVLASQVPDKSTFAAFLEWARTRYARVLFMGGGGTDLLSPAWDAKALAGERFQVPEYDAPLDAYPRSVKHKEFDFSIYELTPPDPERAARPIDLDIGARDDLYVVRFHAKERSEGRSYRWSRNPSYIAVTNVRTDAHEVTLWLSDGGRPAAAGPTDVTVALDNQVLGTVRVTTGFKPYTVSIPPSLTSAIAARGQPVQLRLTSTVWIPALTLGTADTRDLGVMVDRVAIQ